MKGNYAQILIIVMLFITIFSTCTAQCASKCQACVAQCAVNCANKPQPVLCFNGCQNSCSDQPTVKFVSVCVWMNDY